ncbi:unnamed protein product [Prorocentrum cordatum]|uniref:Uncharacterized protein n=1 Tax=Prorocentrum cordatum TaxID=2364126 RepID=A0ABN9UBH7_9DINO|nr:unnamed protein product [Polarella glacialis]
MKPTGDGKHDLGCVDAGGELDVTHTCDWCCAFSVDLFVSSMEKVIEKYGDIHTFVYWKNSGDNFFKCGEFVNAYKRLRTKPVRYVGVQAASKVSRLGRTLPLLSWSRCARFATLCLFLCMILNHPINRVD